MYLIFLQESMNQAGIFPAFMASSISSVRPLPLRTRSMILKDKDASMPWTMR